MADEMSLGEIGRRLNEVQVGLKALDQKVDNLAGVYVRNDLFLLYERQQQSDVSRIQARLEDSERQRRDDRRLIWTSLVAPIVVIILAAIIMAASGFPR